MSVTDWEPRLHPRKRKGAPGGGRFIQKLFKSMLDADKAEMERKRKRQERLARAPGGEGVDYGTFMPNTFARENPPAGAPIGAVSKQKVLAPTDVATARRMRGTAAAMSDEQLRTEVERLQRRLDSPEPGETAVSRRGHVLRLRAVKREIKSRGGKQQPAGGEYGVSFVEKGKAKERRFRTRKGREHFLDRKQERIQVTGYPGKKQPEAGRGPLRGERPARKEQPPAGAQGGYEAMKATAAALGLPWDDEAMKKMLGVQGPTKPAGPPPGEAQKLMGDALAKSPGRGPTGKLRNFKAMKDDKLLGVIDELKNLYVGDPEALDAATAEADKRGLSVDGAAPSAPSLPTPEPTSMETDLALSPGRGPKGNIRNMKAMGYEKLMPLISQLEVYGKDPAALGAAKEAAIEKGWLMPEQEGGDAMDAVMGMAEDLGSTNWNVKDDQGTQVTVDVYDGKAPGRYQVGVSGKYTMLEKFPDEGEAEATGSKTAIRKLAAKVPAGGYGATGEEGYDALQELEKLPETDFLHLSPIALKRIEDTATDVNYHDVAAKAHWALAQKSPEGDIAGLGVLKGKFTPDVAAGDVQQMTADEFTTNFGGVSGKNIVVTGKLMSTTRDGIKMKISNAGGYAQSAISSKTHLLVVGDKPGSKLQKAKDRGIPVMTEQQFLQLVEALIQADNVLWAMHELRRIGEVETQIEEARRAGRGSMAAVLIARHSGLRGRFERHLAEVVGA